MSREQISTQAQASAFARVRQSRTVLLEAIRGKASGELCGNQCDRESRRLGGKGRGARRPRIDFDDYNTAILRVVRKLDVRSADNANRFDNLKGVTLEAFFQSLVDGEERGCAEGVTGMHAHWVDAFDEANRNHLVLCVADNLDFKLFPAENRFFDQALVRHRKFQPVSADVPKLFHVVAESPASAAHRVGRTHHHREADFARSMDELNMKGFLFPMQKKLRICSVTTPKHLYFHINNKNVHSRLTSFFLFLTYEIRCRFYLSVINVFSLFGIVPIGKSAGWAFLYRHLPDYIK